MITELRNQLVADLADAGTVHNSWPDRFTPPGIMVVTPRTASYVTAGQLVGEFEVNLDVITVVAKSANELVSLDSLVEAILINSTDWAFRGVDAISLININGVDYPATVIHLAKQDKLY